MSGRILPKSDIKKAFTYTLNSGMRSIDTSKKVICRWTIIWLSVWLNTPQSVRKNYLFVGNERAGRNAANFYSLVNSAKVNTVEPMAWLMISSHNPYHRDGVAFKQAAAGEEVTSPELDHLLPDRWLEAHPDHVWKIDEIRRQRTRVKTTRLASENSSDANRKACPRQYAVRRTLTTGQNRAENLSRR